MPPASGIRAGRAFIELFTKNNKLIKGLAAARARLKAFAAFARTQGMAIAGFGTGIAAMIAAPLAAAAKHFASFGDSVDKMRGRTGMSAEAISELAFAADRSGADVKTLENGIKRMSRVIVDAGRGLATAKEGLAMVGLTAKDLDGLNPEEQFLKMANGIAAIEDPTRRSAAAQMLFGRAGTQLLPLFTAGEGGLEALRKRAHELGLVMSEEDATAAATLTDSLFDLWASIKMGVFRIGATLAPVLITMADRISKTVGGVIAWMKANQAFLSSALRVVGIVLAIAGSVAVFGAGLASLGFAVSGMLAGLAAIGAAIGFLFNPLTLVAGALVAGVVYFAKYTEAGTQLVAWLSDRFQSLLATVAPVFRAIGAALADGNLSLAAEIAWLGIQAAFQAGIIAVRSDWGEFTIGLWTSFERAINQIRTFWNDLISGIAKALLTVADWLGLVDSEAAIRIIQEDQQAFADGLEQQTDQAAQRRLKENQKALAESKANLARLQAQLAEATQQATQEAKKEAPAPEGPTMPDVTAALQPGQTAGTFSAMAAGLLGRGGGGIQGQQLDALNRIADHTEQGALAGQALNEQLGTA